MEVPILLRQNTEREAAGKKTTRLVEISKRITEKYRGNTSSGKRLVTTDEEALVYAIARMPATYGAVLSALKRTFELLPGMEIDSLLDVGAGTGAATWAAAQLFPLSVADWAEREPAMLSLGKRLITGWDDLTVRPILTDLKDFTSERTYDLVVISYALNEMTAGDRAALLKRVWAATKKALLIVDAGTPKAFAMQREVREILKGEGARLVAPCPHEGKCGMGENDWCHFTCRIPRSKLHRVLKGGASPFEDEKFSYTAVIKGEGHARGEGEKYGEIGRGGKRILRHPQIGTGQVSLTVCRDDGTIGEERYRKGDGAYKSARKAECGDLLRE